MSAQGQPAQGTSPFGRGTVIAAVVAAFAALIALLYFIGAGETGPRRGGEAHAAANGLNGYSALVRLLEAQGIAVERTRRQSQLETQRLLVLTPSANADPERIAQVLEARQWIGPTLLIAPKWTALPVERAALPTGGIEVRDDWVRLGAPQVPDWLAELPAPFAVTLALDASEEERPRFAGHEISGRLPTQVVLHAKPDPQHVTFVTDSASRALAIDVLGEPGSTYYDEAQPLTIVAEPDLLNNYGLADPDRALAAIAIVQSAGYDPDSIAFDLSLAGMGEATNLLTLAFEPPFLAATLCLILALAIVGWRAFVRFGPPAAAPREIAYGKTQLVENGAGLIVRARRLGLLTRPYAQLAERRIARLLGLAKPDRGAIDQALAIRLPDAPSFSDSAAALERANGPAEILRAARTLDDMTRKLAR